VSKKIGCLVNDGVRKICRKMGEERKGVHERVDPCEREKRE